jgi:capsular polysaccharide biosynthesis protein
MWFDNELTISLDEVRIASLYGAIDECIFYYSDSTVWLDGFEGWPESIIELDSIRFHHFEGSTNVAGQYKTLVNSNEVIIPLVHPGYQIYGHWLIDLAPRVWLFEHLFPNTSFTLGIPEDAPDYVIEILSSIYSDDITFCTIFSKVNYKGKLFICSPVRQHDYISQFSGLQPGVNLGGGTPVERLYLTRKKYNTYRSLLNREAVEESFRRRGFRVIDPEDFTPKQQIQLFRSANVLAGEAGSGLHNSVFCSSGVKIINLQSSRQNHFIQAGLCYWRDQDCVYVVGRSTSEDWNASFFVDIESINRAIDFIEM